MEPNLIGLDKFIIFQISDTEFGVYLSLVKEVTEITQLTPVPNCPDYLLGITYLRGKIIPIFDLSAKLKIPNLINCKHILVVDHNGLLSGIRVNQVNEIVTINKSLIKKLAESDPLIANGNYLEGVVFISNAPNLKQKTGLGNNIEELLEEVRRISKKTYLEKKRKIYILDISKFLPTNKDMLNQLTNNQNTIQYS